jgi:hypothetical protein
MKEKMKISNNAAQIVQPITPSVGKGKVVSQTGKDLRVKGGNK